MADSLPSIVHAASTEKGNAAPKRCEVCGTVDKPQIYKGDPWCSDRHRKVYEGEIEPNTAEWNSMDQSLFYKLGGIARRCEPMDFDAIAKEPRGFA